MLLGGQGPPAAPGKRTDGNLSSAASLLGLLLGLAGSHGCPLALPVAPEGSYFSQVEIPTQLLWLATWRPGGSTRPGGPFLPPVAQAHPCLPLSACPPRRNPIIDLEGQIPTLETSSCHVETGAFCRTPPPRQQMTKTAPADKAAPHCLPRRSFQHRAPRRHTPR